MVAEEPVAGSFSHFANKYWGPFAGFLSGWNYWVMFILVGMAELTAAGKYINYCYRYSAGLVAFLLRTINPINVRMYETTDGLHIIKVWRSLA